MRLHRLLPLGLTAGLLAPLPAQLPLLTAPRGTMRIEFGGSFHPTTAVWRDGAKQDLGGLLTLPALTASSTPLLADLEGRLAQLLGRPATATRLSSNLNSA